MGLAVTFAVNLIASILTDGFASVVRQILASNATRLQEKQAGPAILRTRSS